MDSEVEVQVHVQVQEKRHVLVTSGMIQKCVNVWKSMPNHAHYTTVSKSLTKYSKLSKGTQKSEKVCKVLKSVQM